MQQFESEAGVLEGKEGEEEHSCTRGKEEVSCYGESVKGSW